jgi:hypothetical protein
MRDRGLQRYAPLAGVVFVVLIVIAVIIGGESPDPDDSRRSVVEFWTDNDTEQIWSSAIGAWSSIFFVWFAGSLRSALREREGGSARLSALSFAGAIIAAGGLLGLASLGFAAADTAGDVPGDVTQTLSVLGSEFFFPVAAGYAIFLLAAGILAVRTAVLPAWLAWSAIVVGVLCVTPVGFFALLVGLVWLLIVSVLLYRREVGPADRQAPAAPTAPSPAA